MDEPGDAQFDTSSAELVTSHSSRSPSSSSNETIPISIDDATNPSDKKPKASQPLLCLSFLTYFLYAFAPPLVGLLAAFAIGAEWDHVELFNYDWECGKTFLPSISRVVNLPKERTIWNMAILFHVSIRPFLLLQQALLPLRPRRRRRNRHWMLLASTVLFISGLAELSFTVALTVVGEREGPSFHVVFFVGFLLLSVVNLSLATYLCSRSRLQIVVRALLCSLLFILIPAISAAFFLNLNYCVKNAYNVFAALEYVTVLVIFGFHATHLMSMLRCQYVVIRVR